MFKQLITRTPALTRALAPSTTATTTTKTLTPFRSIASVLSFAPPPSFSPSFSRRQYTSSPPPSSKLQEMVLNLTEQLLQPPPDFQPAPTQEVLDALKAKIVPSAHLRNDLNMDIFKTYQLLDKIEQELGGTVDIPVEQAERVHTIQDIINLVSESQK
ncbi:hypothetical protein FBU30_001655 [Linnemannia zychae]|nr:hypothetical protein FBU30_001655 [Linnemannia zychae]